jgi:signal transduction histidine kinase
MFAKKLFDVRIPRGRGNKSFSVLWSIGLFAIAASLGIVAVLQYRWTGQASAADEMRIGSELESLMMKWHSDLYGELSAICIAMQVGPDSGARDDWNDYLQRYVGWNYALPHETLPAVYRNPDLVQEVYIWETSNRTLPRLLLLNIETKKIEPAPVPLDLSALLARLQANSASLSMALRAWQLPRLHPGERSETKVDSSTPQTGSNSMAGWQFDENVPAIVHPIFHRGSGGPLNGQSPVDWIVIALDMTVLRERIMPELSTRYFGGLDGLDDNVAVVATGTERRTIYASDPGFGKQDIRLADCTMGVFVALGQIPNNSAEQGVNCASLKSEKWHRSPRPVWFPVIEYGSIPVLWTFTLQQCASPLEAVIGRVRQKNLAIIALVLLLLVANVGVLSVVGHRAQKFARLQMDFVASFSHELRTPLTAIFSAGENIKDGVVTDKSSLQNYGSLIISQSRQLMENVDRILLFASIRSGKDRYSLRPLDVSEVIQNVRHDTSALMTERSCTVEVDLAPDLPRAMGDLFAVSGCLENLITNAAKYSRGDRRIRISAISQPAESGGQEVVIAVEDHGIGISKADLKRIFEPFYRSEEARAGQIHGTGLGLSLAKHFAAVMGGNITVVSNVGIGSTFSLHLPVAPSNENEPSIIGSGSSKGEGNE